MSNFAPSGMNTLMGEEGFSSDSSLLYHRHIPSAIVDATVWQIPDQRTTPNHPLTPRHLKLHSLFQEEIMASGQARWIEARARITELIETHAVPADAMHPLDKEPVTLGDQTRIFLEDGDTVAISASAPGPSGKRIGFGAVTGCITPSL